MKIQIREEQQEQTQNCEINKTFENDPRIADILEKSLRPMYSLGICEAHNIGDGSNIRTGTFPFDFFVISGI